MTADEKRLQSAGIGILHSGMLCQITQLPQRRRADTQQLAHFAGPVDRPRRDPLGQQQGVKLPFGLRPEVEGRGRSRNAPQTAGEVR